jgi:hypothetical protein
MHQALTALNQPRALAEQGMATWAETILRPTPHLAAAHRHGFDRDNPAAVWPYEKWNLVLWRLGALSPRVPGSHNWEP